MRLSPESWRSNWVSFVHSNYSKVPVNGWAGLNQHFIGTKGSTSKYNKNPYLFITSRNRIYVQNILLIIKPNPSSGGDSGDLDDGRSKTIVTRLGGQVGARACIRCVLFVRRGAGVSLGHIRRGRPSSRGFDPDKLPYPARFESAVLHQVDLTQSGVSVIVRP